MGAGNTDASRSKAGRLVLVFPPMAMLTSPPLAIAMLKGFLARQSPDWDVVTLDLNLWFFLRIFRALGDAKLRLNDELLRRIDADEKSLLKAAATMPDKDSSSFYSQKVTLCRTEYPTSRKR